MNSLRSLFVPDQDSSDSSKAANHSPVQNPLVGSIVYGLVGVVCASLGASIRNENVHEEGIAGLLGGLVSGAIAGAIGMLVTFKSPYIMVRLEPFLQAGAFFLAPAIGPFIAGYHHIQFTNLLIDSLVGSSILFGTAFILLACMLPCCVSSSDKR